MTLLFSAGNQGVDADGNGQVDAGSIGSPATAKNVLAVGASENDRRANWPCDTSLSYTACAARGGQNTIPTYGASWPGSYPANPLRDDPSAGNAKQMAAFSSRGPTTDGRIKPDVVAPGTWTLSGYGDLSLTLLYLLARVSAQCIVIGAVDGIFAVFFAIAYWSTRDHPEGQAG